MKKSTRILLTVIVLLIVSLACVVPNVPAPTQDIHSLETAVMGTMVSGATQTAVSGISVDLIETATPTLTSTSELPTPSPTVTLTPVPLFTSTSTMPLISVSVATNCRTGPGRIYDRVGGLQVGQVAEVVGRNDASNYWYIRNPTRDGFCWLWGEYATVTGNFAALPVYTPPPTPTPMPDFAADYDGLESCSGWWTDLEITNTGGITFESISISVRDTDTDVIASMSSDVFDNIDGCSGASTRDRLNSGDRRIVSGPVFAYNPTGDELRATITLCSRDGLNGTCVTETIRFTP
jgi:hypothetical protein